MGLIVWMVHGNDCVKRLSIMTGFKGCYGQRMNRFQPFYACYGGGTKAIRANGEAMDFLPLKNHITKTTNAFVAIGEQRRVLFSALLRRTRYSLYCIALYLYSSIYIAPVNSHRQTEALLVRLAPRKESSFKK